jgi:toxin YoeB
MSERDREIIVDRDFLEDLTYWVATDHKTARKILELIEAIKRDPFIGIGKPEPLRNLGSGVWSRRITQEHRLVYKVTDQSIFLAQARYYY